MRTVTRNLLFIILTFCFIISGFCQTQKISYPKGIYKTFEDFKSGIPSDTVTNFEIKIGNDTISHRFYNSNTQKRLRKEFAFSDGKYLYINIKGVIKNFPKEDKGQLKDDGNYHIKAKQMGRKYIYFEDYFTSKGAALWGGIIAGSAARRLKGIVYNVEKQTFNLFKNAEDFETFIKQNHTKYISYLPKQINEKGKSKRKKHIEDINIIREIIYKINVE